MGKLSQERRLASNSRLTPPLSDALSSCSLSTHTAIAAASPLFVAALEESANAALDCVCDSALNAAFTDPSSSKPLAKLLSPVDKTFSRVFANFGGGRLGRAAGGGEVQSAVLGALETGSIVSFCDAIFRSTE